MIASDNFKLVIFLSGIFVCLFVSHCFSGVINYKNDPDLAEALKYDFEMNGGKSEVADRALAEKYYFEYLKKNPDIESYQKAGIYAQLGALYTVAMNPLLNEKRDLEKARIYFEKVLEYEPKRIGYTTLRARNMLIALRTKSVGFDRLKAGIEYYEFIDNLSKLDKESLKKLWLPKKPLLGVVKEIRDDNNQGDYETDTKKITKVLSGDELGAYREAYLESQISGLPNYINSVKHGLIYNAVECDARVMEVPLEGLIYILEHLPESAPGREREIVETAMTRLVDPIANEDFRGMLDSFMSDIKTKHIKEEADKTSEIESVSAMNDIMHDQNISEDGLAIKRRFIPHIDFAVKYSIPFIFDLESGKSINTTVKENMLGNEQLYNDLVKLGKGDLFWNGNLLTTRKARLFSATMDSNRPLKYTTGKYEDNYKLPDKVDLPYTLLASNKEGEHYLIRIIKISPKGITLLYQKIIPSEVNQYKLITKKSK